MSAFNDVQFVGSIAGLITFVYTLWDRLASKRPLVKLTAEALAGKPQYSVVVENISRGDILLRKIDAGTMHVANSTSTHDIVRAVSGYAASGLVPAGERRTFALLDVWNGDNVLPVTLKVIWRRADSSRLPQFSIWRRYTSDDVKLIGENASRGPEYQMFVTG